MAKKKDEMTIRSSAAEYLTYVASVGNQQDSIEMRWGCASGTRWAFELTLKQRRGAKGVQ